MAIRWSKRDEKEIKSLLRRYNAKIGYYERKEDYKYKSLIPPKAKYEDIKSRTSTRQELNVKKREIRDFLAKDMRHPVSYVAKPKEIARAKNIVSQYNKAVERIQKKYANKKNDNFKLPEKIRWSEIKYSAASKAKFNEMLSDYNKFAKMKQPKLVTTKQGLTMTKWQYDMLNKGVEEVNAARKREQELFKKSEVFVNGQKIENAIKNDMRDQFNLIETDSEKVRSSNFESFWRYIMKKRLDENFMQTHLTIRESFVSSIEVSNFTRDLKAKILNKVRSLKDELFLEKYYAHPDVLVPDYVYQMSTLYYFGDANAANLFEGEVMYALN